ncbi:hypothetical protein Angca_000567 [Angiostrongylus cantonensis]|nr:hypothetical protein Angca_000567 [Angiostrongylus cantonensis]
MRALDAFSLLFALLCHSSFQQYQPLQSQQRYSYQGNQQGSFYGQQPPGMQQQQQLGQPRGGPPQSNLYQQQYGGSANQFSQQFSQSGRLQSQQQHRVASSSSVVNTPTKLIAYGQSVNGAQVQIRLTSYQNPTMALSNTTTCNCPIAYCDFLPPNQQNACSFSFVTVISSAYQSVQYIQSDFNPFFGSISTGNWTNPHSFQMISKPVSIDIFVQHLGVSIDSATANLLFFGKLILVDSFIVDLSIFKKSGGGDQSLSLVGLQLGTQLQLILNIQCINGMMGEMCDLSCNIPSSYTANNYAICSNNRTGDYFNCTYNSYTSQVVQCQLCATNGNFNGTCMNTIPIQYTGVSSAFRVWTIVLGCLLGIAILLIFCLIISYIM